VWLFYQYLSLTTVKEVYEMLLKVKVKQSRYRPGVAQRVQEVKVPRFLDNGTGW
jgi:hypothetical protein